MSRPFLDSPPKQQTIMTLKLYANLISQPSRTVAWVLKVKGVDHELVEVNPGSDFFKSDEFKAINPNRLVPAIKDGDFVLTEGMAILQYLGDKFEWNGPKDLYPTDLQTRAKINEFLHWHHTNTRLFTLNIVRPEISKKLNAATPKDLAALATKDALVEKEFSLLEAFLVNDFIAHTDFPTIADYTAYCEIDQLELMGYDFAKYPKVSAWIARMKTQPFNDEIHQPLIGFLKQFGLSA
jgi:glutathione S-transferase